MEAVLIYQDNSRINEVKKNRAALQDYLQGFFIEMNRLEIMVTIQELISLSTFGRNTTIEQQKSKIFSFVQNQLVEKADTPNFNGVPINTQVLKELIEIPDLSGLYSILNQYGRIMGIAVSASWFKLEGGLVALSDNSDSIIEDSFTYYTENDTGVEYVNSLLAICEALNSHNEKYPFHVSNRTFNNGLGVPVKGIEIRNLEFVPSVGAIREIEERYPDYVAPAGE